MKSLAVAVWLYSLLTLGVQAIDVTVGQLGVVSGYQETENTVLINIFKGIPFAQPPVGNLRFARPQPLTTFPSPVVNATQLPNTCYSVNTAQTPLSEDCLYLNIFAPNSTSVDASGRAVMIWIYGGTFSSGSSANPLFDGRVLAAYGDVILVSFNYRVGVLGFLYLNTTDVPGNVGLLDQQMAIQWVHDNIKYFGGDANRITVFGESAGAMSTGLQLLSPLNRGIITRAIMQSGCGQSPGAYQTPVQALAASLSIVNVSSCASLNTSLTAVVACLKQMDSATLVQLLKKVRYIPPTLLPTTDNYFLTDTPSNVLAQGRGVNITGILLGTNTYEGRFLIERIFPQLKNGSVVADVNLFNQEVAFYVSSPLGKMAVLFEYTEPAASLGQPVDYKIAAADVEGDCMFVCAASRESDGYTALGKSVYRYQFNHVTVGSLPAWMGASHTSEIEYVFGKPLASWNTNFNYTADEKLFSLQMVYYWTNFAKTGDPNIGNLQQPSVSPTQWPMYTKDNQTYLSLDTNFTYDNFLSARRCTFWNKYLPQLYSYETSLTSPPTPPPTSTPTTPPTSPPTSTPTTTTIACVTSRQPGCSSAILSATSTFSVVSLLTAITLYRLLM